MGRKILRCDAAAASPLLGRWLVGRGFGNPGLGREYTSNSRYQPITVSHQTLSCRILEVSKVAPPGREVLVGSQSQVWVIPGDEPVLHHGLQLLDHIRTHDVVGHV